MGKVYKVFLPIDTTLYYIICTVILRLRASFKLCVCRTIDLQRKTESLYLTESGEKERLSRRQLSHTATGFLQYY